MVLKASQERVRTLLKDTITLLCKNGLEFKKKFNIEALIGVTLDDDEVFLISMNELVSADKNGASAGSDTSDNEECHATPDTTTARTKRRKRRVSDSATTDGEMSQSTVKKEPLSPVHEDTDRDDEGNGANPKSEDFWGSGGDSTNIGVCELESGEPGLKKPHLEREVGEEEIEDIVFVKEESASVSGDGYHQTYDQSGTMVPYSQEQDFSQTTDMTLTPVGSQDGSIVWSQTLQNPQQSPRRNYQPRTSRTSTVTSENSDMAYSQNQQMSQPHNNEQQDHTLSQDLFGKEGDTTRNNTPGLAPPQDYRYHCPYCNKGFGVKSDLRGHLSWHTGQLEYKCSLCGKEYRYKKTLKGHIIRKHSRGNLDFMN